MGLTYEEELDEVTAMRTVSDYVNGCIDILERMSRGDEIATKHSSAANETAKNVLDALAKIGDEQKPGKQG